VLNFVAGILALKMYAPIAFHPKLEVDASDLEECAEHIFGPLVERATLACMEGQCRSKVHQEIGRFEVIGECQIGYASSCKGRSRFLQRHVILSVMDRFKRRYIIISHAFAVPHQEVLYGLMDEYNL